MWIIGWKSFRWIFVQIFDTVCDKFIDAELIDRLYCAEEQFDVSVIVAESTNVLPYSSFRGTGCSKNWVTRFCNQLKNHWCRRSVPFSVWFFSTSSVPRLSESWSWEWPMTTKESDFYRIVNTFCVIFSPLDFIKHRHKDDSSFEFFRFTLYAFHKIFEFPLGSSWILGNFFIQIPSYYHRYHSNPWRSYSSRTIQFSSSTWIIYFTLRKYWIGEDVDFGRNFPFSFFGQKTFRSPCKVSVFRNFQTNNVWCSWTKKFWQFTYLAYYFTHFFRFFVRVLCWRSIVLKSVIWLLMNFFFDSNEFSPFSLPTEIYAWSVSK